MVLDLQLWQILWIGAASFGAAYVRGYSGFGFAALLVSASSIVTDPLPMVSVVILADFAMTAVQAREIRRHIDWKRVGLLLLGCLVGVPLGVRGLNALGIDHARAVIALFILAMCLLLLAGWKMKRTASPVAQVAVGFASGVANGAGVGGLPVAAFFAAQPIVSATFRATLIAYFTLMDLWTLPNMASAGMITRDTVLATAMAMPLMLAGLWAGSRHFFAAAPENFRRFAIFLLALLACLSLLRAIL